MTQIYVHKAFNYRPEGETTRRRIEAGEIIEAKRKDAKVLVGARLAAYVTTEIEEGDLATTAPKRPRGRPRKYPLPASAQETPQEAPRQPEPPPPQPNPPEPAPAAPEAPEAPSSDGQPQGQQQQA
jgi:hypothetical protein